LVSTSDGLLLVHVSKVQLSGYSLSELVLSDAPLSGPVSWDPSSSESVLSDFVSLGFVLSDPPSLDYLLEFVSVLLLE